MDAGFNIENIHKGKKRKVLRKEEGARMEILWLKNVEGAVGSSEVETFNTCQITWILHWPALPEEACSFQSLWVRVETGRPWEAREAWGSLSEPVCSHGGDANWRLVFVK